VKVEAARDALRSFNPDVEVVPMREELLEKQLHIVAEHDVVLDCSDNFATRHAVNRACVKHRKPLVSAAAMRFDGQLMVFDLRKPDAPCYACVFPEDGEVEEVQCSVMGVLAPLTGMLGALQAMEAVKLLSGAGASLDGLVNFDAKTTQWRHSRARKDPACRVCAS
jgi:molybdopterin-synthase adenylyltransferase